MLIDMTSNLVGWPTSTPLMIETNGLTRRFGRRLAVSEVDLAVPAGCAFGFLGHNGAGKTTVIRLLLGMLRPDGGTVQLAGQPLAGDRRRLLARVGAVIEEPRFHPHLTGAENLRVVAAARVPEARERIEPALDRVGLADRAGDRVGTYSQGMRQRLGIARCLLANPQLVILDEPLNGLDPRGMLELRGLIRSLVEEGRTVFLSSHLLDEVEKTCDAVAIIDRGRLLAQGPIDQLIGSDRSTVDLNCGDPATAYALLVGHPGLVDLQRVLHGVRATLVEPAALTTVTSRLTDGGVTLTDIRPVHASLEDRFLSLTSRMGDDR